MLRDFFLGFVKIHILYHADQEPIYGLGIIQELKRHGYDISPGTLYPILHGMDRAGYLEAESRIVEGKVRKYYRATSSGRLVLGEAKAKIRELINEVLDETSGDSP